MTAKILEPITSSNVAGSGISLLQATGIVASKIVTENMFAKTFVGNGTVKSGLWKLGSTLLVGSAGSMMPKVKPFTSVIATGMLIDSVEDMLRGFLGNSASSDSSANEVSQIGGNSSNQGVVPMGAI